MCHIAIAGKRMRKRILRSFIEDPKLPFCPQLERKLIRETSLTKTSLKIRPLSKIPRVKKRYISDDLLSMKKN